MYELFRDVAGEAIVIGAGIVLACNGYPFLGGILVGCVLGAA